jgi:hypothetical protein
VILTWTGKDWHAEVLQPNLLDQGAPDNKVVVQDGRPGYEVGEIQ